MPSRRAALFGLFVAVTVTVGMFVSTAATARDGAAREVAHRKHRSPTVSEDENAQYLELTREVVRTYATSGERYYADGVWQNGDDSCWYCNLGPAVGAAYLSRTEPAMREMAVDSFNTAIGEYREPNGSFEGGSIPGAAFAIMLGLTYMQLGSELDSATRALWQEALAGIADYMVSNHDATWYANGNINCSYAAAFYFAWRATGEQKYLEDYEHELTFVEAPPTPMWQGSGLVITEQPTEADGANGSGYLTEGSPPGWDPEYSHLQLDWLSALYSVSGDPRVLHLLNLILNQELTRVNPSTFMLDAYGGTRKNEMIPFTSAALPLLVIDGYRPDLASLLPAAFGRLSLEYRESFRYTEHNFYRGVALWLVPVLLASSDTQTVSPTLQATSARARHGSHRHARNAEKRERQASRPARHA